MNTDFWPYLNQTVNWLVTSGPRIAVILALIFMGVRLSRVAAARIFAFLGHRWKMDEECRRRAGTLSEVLAYGNHRVDAIRMAGSFIRSGPADP